LCSLCDKLPNTDKLSKFQNATPRNVLQSFHKVCKVIKTKLHKSRKWKKRTLSFSEIKNYANGARSVPRRVIHSVTLKGLIKLNFALNYVFGNKKILLISRLYNSKKTRKSRVIIYFFFSLFKKKISLKEINFFNCIMEVLKTIIKSFLCTLFPDVNKFYSSIILQN